MCYGNNDNCRPIRIRPIMVNDSSSILSSRRYVISNTKEEIMVFLFMFPLNRKPTEEEMESWKEYIIMFYEHKDHLASFEIACA